MAAAPVGIPVRGTQSFVGVMGAVWRRPSLTALEVAWRWAFGVVVLGLVWLKIGADVLRRWREDPFTFQLWVHGGFLLNLNARIVRTTLVEMAAVSLVWALVWSAGRMVILRRFDATLRGRWGTLAVLGVVRMLSLWVLLGMLSEGLYAIARVAVLRPMAAHGEPQYVLGFAGVLGLTLVLFVVWSLVSWVLQLAPVLAMARNLGAAGSVRAALHEGPLRLKLVEINLVMGVVKVALIVLAMVFSASPLPFTSVATQGFLTCWWVGVILLYFVASDYFHVVRSAAYLALLRVYDSVQAS